MNRCLFGLSLLATLLLFVNVVNINAATSNNRRRRRSLLLIEKSIVYNEFPASNLTTWTASLTDSKGNPFGWMNGMCQQTRLLPDLEICTANIFTSEFTVAIQGVYSDDEEGFVNRWAITGGNTKISKLNGFTSILDESKGNGTFHLTFT